MTEEEKMIRGMIYDSSDKVLAMKRTNAHKLSKDYNDTYEDEVEKKRGDTKRIIAQYGKGHSHSGTGTI